MRVYVYIEPGSVLPRHVLVFLAWTYLFFDIHQQTRQYINSKFTRLVGRVTLLNEN